jgi:N-acetylglucosaminyldiphosphoundecaprenol N-acetyl-beta-D-mannosaminyltransferase
MWVNEHVASREMLFERAPVESVEQKLSASRPEPAVPPIAILGVPLNHVTLVEAVGLVEAMVASGEPHYLVTANVDFLVQALHDVELRRVLLDAHLALCDGTPVVWASRLLGNPLPERVAGADLVPLLIRAAARKNYRVYFLGGASEVTAEAVTRLRREYPDINIVGYHSPPFRPLLEMDYQEMARRIRAARPDLLFVSFGCPKAEKWMAMHYRSLGVPVMMGVGATIDFLAGRMKRAPVWMQRTGLEWIFRLLQEPGRLLRRYASDLGYFGRAIVSQWWRMQVCRSRARAPGRASLIIAEPTWQRIAMPERLDVSVVKEDAAFWEQIGTGGRDCLLEMDGVKFIDSTGIALLIGLEKQLRLARRQLVLLSPSRPVQRTLVLMRLENFFMNARNAVEARRLIEARRQEQSAVVVNGETGPLIWQGEITSTNAEEVWRLTETHLDRSSDRQVIDLSGLRFIDSAGVALMVRAKQLARQRGMTLRCAGAGPAVRNVLRLSKLETLLLGEAP